MRQQWPGNGGVHESGSHPDIRQAPARKARRPFKQDRFELTVLGVVWGLFILAGYFVWLAIPYRGIH